MPSWAQALLRLALALLEWWRERKARNRVDAVRADPGAEWVRKFGGTDQRDGQPPSPGSQDAGSGGDR